MHLRTIVDFWARMDRPQADGLWVHPDDAAQFKKHRHSFNLAYPVSPYVGDVLNAPVIILGANAGYNPSITPKEFPNEKAIQEYVARVSAPDRSDWSFVSRYYDSKNYGDAIVSGRAVLVNASPYRSRKISEEPENKRLLEQLTSLRLHREWLARAVLPLVQSGQRRLVLKRHGLWKVPAHAKGLPNVFADPAPISPNLTGRALDALAD